MAVRLPVTGADAAFYSTWVATKWRVKLICDEIGRPVGDTFANEQAQCACQRPMQRGVAVKKDASVQLSAEAEQVYASSPWSADTSLQELVGFQTRVTKPGHGQGTKLMSRVLR